MFTALYPSNPQLGPVFAVALARSLALTLDPSLLQPGQALYSTTVSLWQQVLLSGLLLPQHLPSLVVATAAQLDAGLIPFGVKYSNSACPAHGSSSGSSGESRRGDGRQGSSSNGGSSGSGSRRGAASSLAAQLACSCQNDTATELLAALGDLTLMSEQVSFEGRQSDELPAVMYAASMQLALAGIRAASRAVEQEPENWAGASLYVGLTMASMVAYFSLKPCAGILSGLCYAAEIQQILGEDSPDSVTEVDAEQRVLLESPHFMQGVAVMTVMTACTDLILSTAGAAFRNSSSGGGGCSSSGGSSSSSDPGGSDPGGSSGRSCSGGGSSRAGSISYGWLADVTTEAELQQKMHELGGRVNMQHCSRSNSSDAAKQHLYDWKSNVVGDPDGAWEIACSRHQLLPEPFKLLLQLLGCNSKAALWGACLMVDAIAPYELALPRAQELYTHLVEGRNCMLTQVCMFSVCRVCDY
jgi:uncharacterized membrane protein YgcG